MIIRSDAHLVDQGLNRSGRTAAAGVAGLMPCAAAPFPVQHAFARSVYRRKPTAAPLLTPR
jgi:hypothetical protein